MNPVDYFRHPKLEWQRRYEALRASFLDRLPAKVVAQQFNYSSGYITLLRHLFTTGKLDLAEPVPEGKANRSRVSAATRAKIREYRDADLSSGEIAELLNEDGVEISVRTVERVLREEGYKKLPRRTRLKMAVTVKGANVPEKSTRISIGEIGEQRFVSEHAGIYLFAPFLSQFDWDSVVKHAVLPGSKIIPAKNYLLSFIALKLLGMERFAHAGDYSFDSALGLFAGLNVLPKCTALSTYSYSLDEVNILRLQESFVKQAQRLHLYDGNVVNLDFHTIPHYGDESVLEKNWAGARGKVMKGVLSLIAQDSESRLMLYTAADIQRSEANDQVYAFMKFWKSVYRGVSPTLVFDSKFTDYCHLSGLNRQNIKFITLRRRGDGLIGKLEQITDWRRITIPHPKRTFPNPQVYESTTTLRNYDGLVRQVVIRGNGHEKPAFLITNDFDTGLELLVGTYARRWRVENGIAEAVKFFHLNALSSPILIKVHFDVAMTMIADTIYTMLAKQLRGFEECNAQTIYRNFVKGKGTVAVEDGQINVAYPRRAHNPILRNINGSNFPLNVPGCPGAALNLTFA
jgi:transposase